MRFFCSIWGTPSVPKVSSQPMQRFKPLSMPLIRRIWPNFDHFWVRSIVMGNSAQPCNCPGTAIQVTEANHSLEVGIQAEECFGRVKKLLLPSRVLTHFDGQLPLILECDASPYSLGAVLSHQLPDGTEKPVGFASGTLSKAEQNYSHLDMEAVAIIFGVIKYHQYVYGRQFVIKTDHKPLTHIFSESKAVPTMASGRIQRWAITLGAYDYVIRYKQGSTNANADALNRLPLPTTERETPQPVEVVHLIEHLSTTPLFSQHIKTLTDVDPSLSRSDVSCRRGGQTMLQRWSVTKSSRRTRRGG